MSFDGKIAVVTGATRGIGREIAYQLAQRGATVVALGSNEASVASLAEDARSKNIKLDTAVCNVADENAVKETAAAVLDRYGKVDILVNNAGLWRSGNALFAESDSENWRKKIDINILCTMYITRAVINSMIENRYGRVINIASVAGVYGIRTMTDYSMTKGAIIAFTTALAKEVTEYGVTVNAVSPGNILSDSEKESDNARLSFMRRSGTNEECANVVTFLASDEASYVSGQNYLVDGCRAAM